jgi:hypothetical protein
MRKLMLIVLAVASLEAGAAFAQDAESGAGGAWRVTPNPNLIPGTPEYYGNSGWPPAPPQQPQSSYYGDRVYPAPNARGNPAPAYPYLRPRRGDRDGDGVPNQRDRHPDDPSRW